MRFDEFGLIEPLLRAVLDQGYPHPTEIQEKAIPHVLEGKDLLGCAQTGTGKTAAFALPILQRLHNTPPADSSRRPIRTLVLTPTRELAAQVCKSFETYGRHTHVRTTVIFGGVRQRAQVAALQQGVDVLVATPGRLMDLCGQGYVDLKQVEVLVLDEADRMLDMGFIQDIRRIVVMLPRQRQTLFFSATMPREIMALAKDILHDQVEIRVQPQHPAALTVAQVVYFVERTHKQALLQHLLSKGDVRRALIFTRTKHGADRVGRNLRDANISADVIHSNKSQNERERTLQKFRAGHTRVLVASDIASRGLDIDDISHVINFDMPNEPETYVHRIGRTGRAGESGTAWSFCGIDERIYLDEIERLIRQNVPAIHEHPFLSPIPRAAKKLPPSPDAPPPVSNGWKRLTHRSLLTGRRRR